MKLQVKLYPSLNEAAGCSSLLLTLEAEQATVREMMRSLIDRFGEKFRRCLFDENGRPIAAWSVFINHRRPVHFNQADLLDLPLTDGGMVSFLLALAGG